MISEAAYQVGKKGSRAEGFAMSLMKRRTCWWYFLAQTGSNLVSTAAA